MNSNEYLPIGSVVKIKDNENKLMIIGFRVYHGPENDKKLYDYNSVPTPRGLKSASLYTPFNRDQIEEIIARGYEDEEWKVAKEVLQSKD